MEKQKKQTEREVVKSLVHSWLNDPCFDPVEATPEILIENHVFDDEKEQE